jgi:hypothetical protein
VSNISFKAFGVFCFSVIRFGFGTFLAGVLMSCGEDDCVFPIAWLVGSVVFGIAMVVAYG